MLRWFDEAADDVVPDHDGTIDTACGTADANARQAKADNIRPAYHVGVRAWCAWCDLHTLPCLRRPAPPMSPPSSPLSEGAA